MTASVTLSTSSAPWTVNVSRQGSEITVSPDVTDDPPTGLLFTNIIAAVALVSREPTHTRQHQAAGRSIQIIRGSASRHWVAGGDLLVPVPVTVQFDDDASVIVSNDETGIFGAGSDLAAAITDLRTALREHHHALTTSKYELSDGLEDQRKYLDAHLRDTPAQE